MRPGAAFNKSMHGFRSHQSPPCRQITGSSAAQRRMIAPSFGLKGAIKGRIRGIRGHLDRITDFLDTDRHTHVESRFF